MALFMTYLNDQWKKLSKTKNAWNKLVQARELGEAPPTQQPNDCTQASISRTLCQPAQGTRYMKYNVHEVLSYMRMKKIQIRHKKIWEGGGLLHKHRHRRNDTCHHFYL